MRQQVTIAKKRGKDQYVILADPSASIDAHRQAYKEIRRNGNESADFEELLVFEKVKQIALVKPKPAAPKPK